VNKFHYVFIEGVGGFLLFEKKSYINIFCLFLNPLTELDWREEEGEIEEEEILDS